MDLFDADSTKRAQRIQEREEKVRVSQFYTKQKPEHVPDLEHDGKERCRYVHIQCFNDLDSDTSSDDGPIIPSINPLEKARKLWPNIETTKKATNKNKAGNKTKKKIN